MKSDRDRKKKKMEKEIWRQYRRNSFKFLADGKNAVLFV